MFLILFLVEHFRKSLGIKKRNLVSGFITMQLLIFQKLSALGVQYVNCYEINRTSYLHMDATYKCNQEGHMVVFLGWLFLVFCVMSFCIFIAVGCSFLKNGVISLGTFLWGMAFPGPVLIYSVFGGVYQTLIRREPEGQTQEGDARAPDGHPEVRPDASDPQPSTSGSNDSPEITSGARLGPDASESEPEEGSLGTSRNDTATDENEPLLPKGKGKGKGKTSSETQHTAGAASSKEGDGNIRSHVTTEDRNQDGESGSGSHDESGSGHPEPSAPQFDDSIELEEEEEDEEKDLIKIVISTLQGSFKDMTVTFPLWKKQKEQVNEQTNKQTQVNFKVIWMGVFLAFRFSLVYVHLKVHRADERAFALFIICLARLLINFTAQPYKKDTWLNAASVFSLLLLCLLSICNLVIADHFQTNTCKKNDMVRKMTIITRFITKLMVFLLTVFFCAYVCLCLLVKIVRFLRWLKGAPMRCFFSVVFGSRGEEDAHT